MWPELRIAARVGDGLSAARQALALQPDVCFLDIRMPGASGLETAQALAEDWPEGLPFPLLVFVTAYDQYALQAFDAQAVDYLVKPVDGPRLEACVARLKLRLADRAAAGLAAVDLAARACRSALQHRHRQPAPRGSTPVCSRPSTNCVRCWSAARPPRPQSGWR